MVNCHFCFDTGIIVTGNNDLPCSYCEKGDTALFNDAQVEGGPINGALVKRHFLNDSPEPIEGTVQRADLIKRALVVDDDDSNRKYIRGLLTKLGFEVVEAKDGRQGVRTFRRDDEGFALVVSDWSMPNMTGTEMVQKIRELEPGQRVLMMSFEPRMVLLALQDLKMFDTHVLRKPVHPDEFQDEVDKLFERVTDEGRSTPQVNQ